MAFKTGAKILRTEAWALNETGSGTVLSVAAIGLMFSVFMLAQVPLREVCSQAAAEVAADQSAIAAENVLRGFNTGVPCAAASALALQNGARLQTCRIVENNVSVSVLLGSRIVAEATAGF
jgi:secretion/DNA translocation related TadE-like protein